MIDFNYLEQNKRILREKYLTANPFPHLVLANICDEAKLKALYTQIPRLENSSRDLMFAKNKFEKSNYSELGPLFIELQNDLRSKEMNAFLSYLTGKQTFVDPNNHGGGLHQGRENSFLDMHLDYNYHPIEQNWWRELNLLLYMNEGWIPDYGGHLKIKDLRTDESKELEVGFNTLIIQHCNDFTLHGYDLTNFPEGKFRTSIATYAFTEHKTQIYKSRTTDWFPSQKGSTAAKKFLGRQMPKLVKLKSIFMSSRTAKNQ